MQLALVALLALFLQVHGQFRRDDGFQIVGLREPLGLHVVVHHQQRMLQIGAGEAVGLHLVQVPVHHVVTENGSEHRPDPALALTAFAHQHQHLLGLGRGDQAVAHILLQRGNVLRIQKFMEKAEPALRRRCVGDIGHRQPVPTVFFVLGERTIQKQRSVCHMDTVGLQRQIFQIGLRPQHLQDAVQLFGHTAADRSLELVVDQLFQLTLVGDPLVHREEGSLYADHRVLCQVFLAEQDLVDLLPVEPPRQLCYFLHSFHLFS